MERKTLKTLSGKKSLELSEIDNSWEQIRKKSVKHIEIRTTKIPVFAIKIVNSFFLQIVIGFFVILWHLDCLQMGGNSCPSVQARY